MVVTISPIEYAKAQRKFWQSRLDGASRMGTKGRNGEWPSQKAKDIELATCRGAIAAFTEIIEAKYAN